MSPHGTAEHRDQSSRNSENKCWLARPLTLPNFATLQKAVCEISNVAPGKWTKVRQNPLRSAMHHAPISAKFHNARPNDEREKRCKIFFTPFSILAPQGDPMGQSLVPLGQSLPISALCTAKSGLPSCQISSPSDNLSMRYLLLNFVDFVGSITSRHGPQKQ